MTTQKALTIMSPESMSAAGRSSEKLSLHLLQSKMKSDPEGYESELFLVYNQFKSSVELFEQQVAFNFTSISGIGTDPTVAKDLSDRAMLLAHVTPFYPNQLSQFPKELTKLLSSSACSLPSGLRYHLAQALILLINKKMVDLGETLALFMELQTLGDKVLKKLAFTHVVHSIRRMNKKHKNEPKNRALQNILFGMLQQEDEAKAKRSLTTLCELHRRKVWFDDRTANAICNGCFHTSRRIMIASLSFLLDYEKIEDDDDDSDALSSEDELTQNPQVVLNKEAVYKAHHKGTASSKRKKQAKLQRAMRSMKRQQRLTSQSSTSTYYSPLNHLKDPQGFAEKLFSQLQTREKQHTERFEVKLMMMKLIARIIGLHRLIVLSFYDYFIKYVKPHQRDVTNLLAAVVQSCHDMVPPDAVEDLFKQVVNQFVHENSRPEAIAVGLNVVREICLRIPLLMTEDLLQDLALYKKSHEKAVSAAARSLIGLFREICPSLLVKKDRGRPRDPMARPKDYGEVNVHSNVPDIELLNDDHGDEGESEGDDHDVASNLASSDSDDAHDIDEMVASSEEEDHEGSTYDDEELKDDIVSEDEDADDSMDDEDGDEEETDGEKDESEEMEHASDGESDKKESKGKKRKLSEFDHQLITAETSLNTLRKMAKETLTNANSDQEDGILANEDFHKIKELKAKMALTQHGFKFLNSDNMSLKRVDPAKLEAHVRMKMSKEERLALVRAGREDRGKYQARAAVKQKKVGGLSNRQKEHKKVLPLAAKRSKVAKSKQEKKRKQQRSGKQFRGKKAWK